MLKRSRIVIMVVLVFSVIICYVFELMQYQVSQGDDYRQKSSKSTIDTMSIIAPRGDILDRYGRVLATSTVGYSILIESAYFPSSAYKEKQDKELLALTDILTQSGETWEDSLPVSTTAPYTYTGAKKKIAALITYINEHKAKGEAKVGSDASAPAVMAALEKIFKTEGYTQAQQRTLCGIRYEMVLTYYSTTKVYTFAENIGIDTVTKIEERSSSLPGAVAQQVPVRSYPDGKIAPHIIGITGRINESELSKYKSKGYTAEDNIGKFGIEKSMESYLRGTDGVQQVEQNSNGDVTSTSIVTEPEPGDNVVLTLDKDLQVTMQNSLPQIVQQIKADAVKYNTAGADAKGAAAVVLNIKTGEVLAMATYPSYDLNTYNKSYSTLANDKLNPLFNRCIQGAYTPGSTFKPIVAVSGLINNAITEDTSWDLPATLTIGTGSTAWTGHDDEGRSRSNINVEEAISVSSNIFFFKLGTSLGIDKIAATAKIFGIGQKTGIELPSESAGVMSNVSEKKERTGLAWYEADTAQASIGQFDTVATPLQLANYVSTLVKGGTEYQVHIVKQVNSYDNSKIIIDNSTPTVISKTEISSSIIDTVKKGMLSVTESGTAASVFSSFNMKIGGKTGTAQINLNNGYNGVFICFAPYDDPEIAIATVVEYGHNGYQTAPVAKTAMQQYFGLDENGNAKVSTTSDVKVGSLIQ